MQSFRHGMTTVDRIVDVETSLLGSGQGELGAARSNLSFPIRLLMPIVFSRLYVSASVDGSMSVSVRASASVDRSAIFCREALVLC
jgi:hypothetical protein